MDPKRAAESELKVWSGHWQVGEPSQEQEQPWMEPLPAGVEPLPPVTPDQVEEALGALAGKWSSIRGEYGLYGKIFSMCKL